jgi:hypothetical protein
LAGRSAHSRRDHGDQAIERKSMSLMFDRALIMFIQQCVQPSSGSGSSALANTGSYQCRECLLGISSHPACPYPRQGLGLLSSYHGRCDAPLFGRGPLARLFSRSPDAARTSRHELAGGSWCDFSLRRCFVWVQAIWRRRSEQPVEVAQ